MNWKVVFLAALILSSAAVTLAVVSQDMEVLETFGASPRQFILDEQVPLQPIDDEPGG